MHKELEKIVSVRELIFLSLSNHLPRLQIFDRIRHILIRLAGMKINGSCLIWENIKFNFWQDYIKEKRKARALSDGLFLIMQIAKRRASSRYISKKQFLVLRAMA
jgi:hypothetical protein